MEGVSMEQAAVGLIKTEVVLKYLKTQITCYFVWFNKNRSCIEIFRLSSTQLLIYCLIKTEVVYRMYVYFILLNDISLVQIKCL